MSCGKFKYYLHIYNSITKMATIANIIFKTRFFRSLLKVDMIAKHINDSTKQNTLTLFLRL